MDAITRYAFTRRDTCLDDSRRRTIEMIYSNNHLYSLFPLLAASATLSIAVLAPGRRVPWTLASSPSMYVVLYVIEHRKEDK